MESYENFVIVPADKVSSTYTFVCKRYYVDILIGLRELGLHLLPGNPTYYLTDFSASDDLDIHKSVLTSFGIQTTDEDFDLPYIYWIPKMLKYPYKHRFIAGSSKCSTKPLSILLTTLLTHIKANMKNYKQLATAAIFFLANLFLKQGIVLFIATSYHAGESFHLVMYSVM